MTDRFEIYIARSVNKVDFTDSAIDVTEVFSKQSIDVPMPLTDSDMDPERADDGDNQTNDDVSEHFGAEADVGASITDKVKTAPDYNIDSELVVVDMFGTEDEKIDPAVSSKKDIRTEFDNENVICKTTSSNKPKIGERDKKENKNYPSKDQKESSEPRREGSQQGYLETDLDDLANKTRIVRSTLSVPETVASIRHLQGFKHITGMTVDHYDNSKVCNKVSVRARSLMHANQIVFSEQSDTFKIEDKIPVSSYSLHDTKQTDFAETVSDLNPVSEVENVDGFKVVSGESMSSRNLQNVTPLDLKSTGAFVNIEQTSIPYMASQDSKEIDFAENVKRVNIRAQEFQNSKAFSNASQTDVTKNDEDGLTSKEDIDQIAKEEVIPARSRIQDDIQQRNVGKDQIQIEREHTALENRETLDVDASDKLHEHIGLSETVDKESSHVRPLNDAGQVESIRHEAPGIKENSTLLNSGNLNSETHKTLAEDKNFTETENKETATSKSLYMPTPLNLSEDNYLLNKYDTTLLETDALTDKRLGNLGEEIAKSSERSVNPQMLQNINQATLTEDLNRFLKENEENTASVTYGTQEDGRHEISDKDVDKHNEESRKTAANFDFLHNANENDVDKSKDKINARKKLLLNFEALNVEEHSSSDSCVERNEAENESQIIFRTAPDYIEVNRSEHVDTPVSENIAPEPDTSETLRQSIIPNKETDSSGKENLGPEGLDGFSPLNAELERRLKILEEDRKKETESRQFLYADRKVNLRQSGFREENIKQKPESIQKVRRLPSLSEVNGQESLSKVVTNGKTCDVLNQRPVPDTALSWVRAKDTYPYRPSLRQSFKSSSTGAEHGTRYASPVYSNKSEKRHYDSRSLPGWRSEESVERRRSYSVHSGVSSDYGYHPSRSATATSRTVSGQRLNRTSEGNQSFLTGLSEGPVCRICQEGDDHEVLISPCYCAGSMGLLHISCLQKWLGASNKTNCEICNFEFLVERKPMPITQFIRDPGNVGDRRNLLCDVVCVSVITPITIVTTYLCINGALKYYSGEEWERSGLLALAGVLISVFLIWFLVMLKHNYGLWRDWKMFHQEVTLLATPRIGVSKKSHRSVLPRKDPTGSIRSKSTGQSSAGTIQLQSIKISVSGPLGRHNSPKLGIGRPRLAQGPNYQLTKNLPSLPPYYKSPSSKGSTNRSSYSPSSSHALSSNLSKHLQTSSKSSVQGSVYEPRKYHDQVRRELEMQQPEKKVHPVFHDRQRSRSEVRQATLQKQAHIETDQLKEKANFASDRKTPTTVREQYPQTPDTVPHTVRRDPYTTIRGPHPTSRDVYGQPKYGYTTQRNLETYDPTLFMSQDHSEMQNSSNMHKSRGQQNERQASTEQDLEDIPKFELKPNQDREKRQMILQCRQPDNLNSSNCAKSPSAHEDLQERRRQGSSREFYVKIKKNLTEEKTKLDESKYLSPHRQFTESEIFSRGNSPGASLTKVKSDSSTTDTYVTSYSSLED